MPVSSVLVTSSMVLEPGAEPQTSWLYVVSCVVTGAEAWPPAAADLRGLLWLECGLGAVGTQGLRPRKGTKSALVCPVYDWPSRLLLLLSTPHTSEWAAPHRRAHHPIPVQSPPPSAICLLLKCPLNHSSSFPKFPSLALPFWGPVFLAVRVDLCT